MQVRAKITVIGMVQGVGFRYFTQREARKLSLNGFVKNQYDGTVYCEVEGERGLIEEFIKILRVGPAWAKVSSVQVEWDNYKGDLTSYHVTH